MISFNLHHFLKCPISKYSHSWGGVVVVRASTYEFGGDTIQSKTRMKKNIPHWICFRVRYLCVSDLLLQKWPTLSNFPMDYCAKKELLSPFFLFVAFYKGPLFFFNPSLAFAWSQKELGVCHNEEEGEGRRKKIHSVPLFFAVINNACT